MKALNSEVVKVTMNLHNRYSNLTNENHHDENVVNVKTNNQIGSRKNRQRFNICRDNLLFV